MSTTDTRAAFEALIANGPLSYLTAQRMDNGEYISKRTRAAWTAWQAATEAAKATGTAGELPPLPEEIEVGGEGWGWEDFQSEKTFSVEHMLHYGAACAQAAIAEAARQPAPVDEIEQAAKAIYQLIPGDEQGSPADHPWQPGGNSDMQDLARRMARAALAATNRSQP